MNYGLVVSKNFGQEKELGVGVRVEYAFNCSTTFMGEYNRSFNFDTSDENQKTGYNEFAFGVNLILFNWYPTTITAGIGYIANDGTLLDTTEDTSFLSFETGDINHGAQIKIRALHQLSDPIHVFGELNIKSLGSQYHTFLVGISYDFYH